MEPQTYRPGVCNIGSFEKQKRFRTGLAGALITSGWTFLSYVWVFPVYLKVLVIIPVFIMTLGFLQYRNSFCVAFALGNRQNVGDKPQLERVTDLKAQTIDRQKAMSLIFISIIVSFVYTLLVLLFF